MRSYHVHAWLVINFLERLGGIGVSDLGFVNTQGRHREVIELTGFWSNTRHLGHVKYALHELP